MQPNDPQGYYQPEQPQPVPPAAPPQPVVGQPAPALDQNALQAALNEPGQAPAPAPVDGQYIEGAEEGEIIESDEPAVSWVAHEYIHQEKGKTWFMIFAVVIVALIAVSIFLMNSWSFAVLLGVIAVVVVIYSRRPPRELSYSLTDEGLYVDDKLYHFESFKSFGVIHDGEEFSVMLIPTQRFQPGITVYFPEESGEDIVDVLGSRLPMKDLKLDAVDRIVRLLRL